MSKLQLEGSMKSIGNHIDPEKEEQLKFLKIEIENKVKRTLKLAKSVNGNKDGDSKKKSELIHLIGDFHQQYESLYSLYEDLRQELKNNASFGDDDSSSTSSSDSESNYYSPDEANFKNSETSSSGESPNTPHIDNHEPESFYIEEIILKDKLICSSEVKEKTTFFGLESQEFNEILKDLTIKEEEDLENEAMQMQEKIARMERRVLEQEDNEQCYLSKISDLFEQTKNLQLEVNNLNLQRGELEERLSFETKERYDQVKGLMEQVDSLQKELVNVKCDKAELEMELRKKSAEISELQTYLSEKENEISDQKEKFKACQNDLFAQIDILNEKVKNQENTLEVLQNERNSLQVEVEALRNEKEQYQESLICKYRIMEKKNTELINKIADQQKTLLELGDEMSKLKVENEKSQAIISYYSKSNFNLVERKIEEMAEDFRKQFEDKYRILSQRIKVAEQLHLEQKEWYLRTKETYEQETKELKEKFINVKDMSIKANDVFISLDSLALKFEECTDNFMNRISKSSCEMKFAKEWAVRKKKALLHVKYDQDCLLLKLDDKEAEILIFREKVWKLENEVRELKKMIKEKEDGMLGLQEEKREAIRQLCVWIDYHRSRSDYYKKMLSEINRGRIRKGS